MRTTNLTVLEEVQQNVPVEVGTATGSRDVEEEEQILEVELVCAIVALRSRVRPTLDSPLAVGVVVVVRGGADRREQSHCNSKMANRPSAAKKNRAGSGDFRRGGQVKVILGERILAAGGEAGTGEGEQGYLPDTAARSAMARTRPSGRAMDSAGGILRRSDLAARRPVGD
jgi:hypothetical protein